MTAPSFTTPIAFSNSTYRMQCSQPRGVKMAVVIVTTTGRYTSDQRGMCTCTSQHLSHCPALSCSCALQRRPATAAALKQISCPAAARHKLVLREGW